MRKFVPISICAMFHIPSEALTNYIVRLAFVFSLLLSFLFARSFVSLSTCVSNSMPICPFNVMSHGEIARFRSYFFSVRFTLRSKIGLTSLEYWGVDEVIYFIVANKRCILCEIAKSFITTRKR